MICEKNQPGIRYRKKRRSVNALQARFACAGAYA